MTEAVCRDRAGSPGNPHRSTLDDRAPVPWLGSITAEPGWFYRYGHDARLLCSRCIVEVICAERGRQAITWEVNTDSARRCERCERRLTG
jgi:hypothetical protein